MAKKVASEVQALIFAKGEVRMRTFFIFGKASAEELREISIKYRAQAVRLVESFGGDVRSIYMMLREKYLVFVFAFPGLREAVKASLALSKLTGISFQTFPAVLVN